MKKVIILFILLALSFSTYSCGGGGAGSLDSPGGENPGTPSVVKLMPSHYVAQTNSFISLHTKVLDGNGRPVQNIPVTYTNLSNPFGEIISSALKSLGLYKPVGMLSTSVVKTDSFGIATVKLTSTTAGFATIQSEVNTGAGIVRDQKTIFFTTATGSSAPPPPTLKLHVKDATNDTYDEPEDFNLLKASGDNTRTVKAVVRDGFGAPFSGVAVTFGSDSPGEVTFDRGTVLTGTGTEAGNAYVVMTVNPAIITKLKRYINISAAADTNGNGTYETGNMLTLFLEPVTVSSITVAANPSVVAPNGTSTIQAVVSLNTGNPTPDGSSVGFTTSCGMVTPFGQTLGGVATATFTAPSIPPSNNICRITASIGGQIGTADVRVTTSLTVQPNTQTINGVIGGIATFTIYGGVAPYTVTSNNIDFPPYLSGNEFTVNVGENSIPRTITYTVRDSIGATVTATLTIAGGASLAVLPSSVTVDSAAPDDTVYFTIFGGVAPYSVFSDNQAYQPIIVSNNQFSILVPAGAPEETVVLTVRDENGDTATAKVDITAVPPQALAVIPASQTIANPAINNAADYTVIGGKAPYSAFSDKPGFATVSVAASTVTALVAAVPTEDTTVTISIYDSLGNRINASLILDLPPLVPLAVIPASQTISNPAGGETADYQVIGGSGGYTAFSSNPAAASVAVAGSVVTATVGTPPTTDTTVTITIYDSSGSSRAATLILDLSPLIPLAVIPASQTISNPAAGNARNYTVIGGTGGYTAFSDNPIVADVAVAGSVVTATVGTPPTTDTTVTITIYDSSGSNVSASLVLDITPVGVLSVVPEAITITGLTNPDANPADDVTFYISGGTGPYLMFSDNNAVIASQGALGGSDFTIDPEAVSSSTTVKLTVADSLGATDSVNVTVTPATSSMAINPSAITVDVGTVITFNIIGGLPNYSIYTSDMTLLTLTSNPEVTGTPSFTATASAAGSATITVVDSDGKSVQATVTITAPTPPPPPTAVSVAPPTATICEDNATCSAGTDVAVFTISGGTPTPNYIATQVAPAFPPNTVTITFITSDRFTVDAVNLDFSADTPVTILVDDQSGNPGGTALVTVNVINQ